MGYWIGCNNESLWEPSLTIGKLFFGQVRILEDILNSESGFISEASDMINIEQEKFNNFLLMLLKFYSENSHEVLAHQLLPTLSILIEISRRLNPENQLGTKIPNEVEILSKSVSKHMPS